MLGVGPMELFFRGKGPCVVAFHGFTGTVSELRPLLTAAGDRGYAVDGALLAGHGTGAEKLQPLDFDDWVKPARERVRAAVAAYGRVVLLGYSLGSLVAMQIASERPEGLAGLAVLSNALTLSAASSVPLGLWERTGRMMPDVYLVKPKPGDLVDTTLMGQIVTYDRHPMQAALEVYKAGKRVLPVVERIACPTLVLHGRRDAVCPVKNATWLGEHLGARESRVAVFDRSAHVMALDGERDAVTAEVLAFLDRVA